MRQELSSCSDLTLHLYCCRYPALRSLCMPAEALLTSGKSAMLATLLPPLLADGHRVLIFSQWTSTLDTLGLLLDHLNISCVRFDGSTPAPERQRLIDAFNADATIGVFLLTTRAGGLGINLTAADTVIIHDVDFNPAADKQAMDRAHRMGQLRPVRVIKLASAKTVDEQVLKIAASKLRQQSVLLGGAPRPAAKGEEGEEAQEDLMGGILRELLSSSRTQGAAKQGAAKQGAAKTAAKGKGGAVEDKGGAEVVAEGGEAVKPMEVEAEAAAEVEVEAEAEAEVEAEAEAEAEVASMDAQGEEGGAEGGGAPPSPSAGGTAPSTVASTAPTEAVPLVPTEAQLREHIVSELQAFSEGTLRQAIDRASAHFSVDVRASGLKPLIKQLLGELL